MAEYPIRTATLQGGYNGFDTGALVCDLVMLGICVWNHVCYGLNMLFLIIPLVLIAVYLILFCMLIEEYHFTEASLEIRHKIRRTVVIPYKSVFNYESSARDSFINIHQSNRVKVYYMRVGKKKVIHCMPRDVSTFVEILKWNCPEFHEDVIAKSKLEVFFNGKE